MKWHKSSPALVERFDALVPADRRVERRQMFGYPAAFLNGHLMMSLFQESLLLRLGERDRAELLSQPGARTFEPMPGRPMKEYVVVPPPLVGDDEALAEWIDRAVGFVGALPAKTRKATAKQPAAKQPTAKKAPAKQPAAKKKPARR